MADVRGQVPAITVEGVSKRFRTPEEATHTLKEQALHPLRRRRQREFTALDDVSFEVRPGEFFGIVGRNGSGKSTLLKCLAGIYGIDRGRMFRSGRMATFIELGVGFNPDLAAYDNVVLNGIMMGLTQAEAKARYPRIIEFAGLEEFQELKLKNYSSGMHVRLAFSVAIQVDADILLIDEVLAVGDAAFQQKCFDVFTRMREERRTILFVTHDMASINRLCHRALLLHRGRVDIVGEPSAVGARYLELNFEQQASTNGGGRPRAGDGCARIVDAWIEDHRGVRHDHFLSGTRNTFRAVVEFHRTVKDPSLTLAFPNERQVNAFILSTIPEHGATGTFHAGERASFAATFDNVLAPGRYEPLANLAHHGAGHDLIDRWERELSIVVVGQRPTGGIVDVPCEWRVESAARDQPMQRPA
ncbi:MAG: ABC transporter ATP-binding protein [Solirubrobacteraceae bacterium]